MKLKVITILIMLFFSSFAKSQSNIDEYLKIVVDSNPNLQAAYKEYEMALERVPQAKGLPNPIFSLAYGLSPVETRFGAQQAKLSVMQTFPWFGTLNAKGKQSAMTAQAAYENYIAVKNKTLFDVKSVWYNLYFVEKSIMYTQKQIEIFDMLEQQTTIKFESNQGGMVDVLRFQMAKDELQSKIEHLKDIKQTAGIQFNLMLNRDITSLIYIAHSLIMPENKLFALDSIFRNNPKLKAIDAVKLSNNYQVKSSKLSGYPSIGIGLDYAFIGNRTDMQVEGSGTDAIMPMLSLSVPLYRSKYKAKVRESILKQEQLVYQKEAMQNTLLGEYEQAMQDYNDAKRNLKLYESLLSKANQTLNILKTAYATSGKDYDQLLQVQNTLLKYQINYEKALSDLYKAVAYLEYLVAR